MKKIIIAWICIILIAGSFVACTGTLKGLPNGSFSTRIEGVAVHYAIHGQGPVCMVLTNSWGLSHQGVRALLKPLEAHMTMIYFDPRGMGESSPIQNPEDMSMQTVRKDLEALRRNLNLDKVIVAGWSNGAMNLLKYAAEYPKSISKGIFLHGTAYNDPSEQQKLQQKYPELMQAFMQFFSRISQSQASEEQKNLELKTFIINTWFPNLMADKKAASRKLAALYEKTSFSINHLQYSFSTDRHFDARADLAKIRCPFLVISGQHDMISVDQVKKVHEEIPGSTYIEFESSGHFSPIEEKDLFVKTILDFVRS